MFRFFKSLEEHPRFATKFVDKISRCIDPEFLGSSTITWWKNVKFSFEELKNTKPFYIKFCKFILSDLRISDRVETTGLTTLLSDVVKHSFAGEPCTPPAETKVYLEKLFSEDHALCYITVKGKRVIHVAAWPSWLCKGFKSHITAFNKLFYAEEEAQPNCH